MMSLIVLHIYKSIKEMADLYAVCNLLFNPTIYFYCRDAQRIVLEEEKIRLEETLHATQPEVYAKFKKLEEIDRETECIIAEIKRRY